MKKLLTFIVIVFAFTMSMSAQKAEIKREGNNFTEVKSVRTSSTTLTPYTYTDAKGVEYPIYITGNGRCYINKISKNNKEYKKYLDKETCLVICKEMNIEYKERENKK